MYSSRPLITLDAEEADPEEDGGQQQVNQLLALSQLRGADCQARQSELLQIRTAVFNVPAIKFKLRLPAAKSGSTAAVNQIGAEHTAKKHDFGAQKQPHAERGGMCAAAPCRRSDAAAPGWFGSMRSGYIRCRLIAQAVTSSGAGMSS